MSYQFYVYVYDKTINFSELSYYKTVCYWENCVRVLRNHLTANQYTTDKWNDKCYLNDWLT